MIFSYIDDIDDLLSRLKVCRRWHFILSKSRFLWRQIAFSVALKWGGRLYHEVGHHFENYGLCKAEVPFDLLSDELFPIVVEIASQNHRKDDVFSNAKNCKRRQISFGSESVSAEIRVAADIKGLVVDFSRQTCAVLVKETNVGYYMSVRRLIDLTEIKRIPCCRLTSLVGIHDWVLIFKKGPGRMIYCCWDESEPVGRVFPDKTIYVSGVEVIRLVGVHVFVQLIDGPLEVYVAPCYDPNQGMNRTALAPFHLPLPGYVEKFWAVEGRMGETVVRVLTRRDERDASKKPRLTLSTLRLRYRECRLVETVDVNDQLEHLCRTSMRASVEQRLLVVRPDRENSCCRFAQDLRSPINSFRGKFVLPRHLKPMRNQSRRWLYLLDTRNSSLEIRDAESGEKKMAANNATTNAAAEEDLVDMEYANHFDADDFSFVLTRARGGLSHLIYNDFFNAYKRTFRLNRRRSQSVGDMNAAWNSW